MQSERSGLRRNRRPLQRRRCSVHGGDIPRGAGAVRQKHKHLAHQASLKGLDLIETPVSRVDKAHSARALSVGYFHVSDILLFINKPPKNRPSLRRFVGTNKALSDKHYSLRARSRKLSVLELCLLYIKII